MTFEEARNKLWSDQVQKMLADSIEMIEYLKRAIEESEKTDGCKHQDK